MTSKINKNKILLVEGRDEINFFDALLKSCTLDTIQVIESKGKDQFPFELELIVNDPGFANVTSIGIVRDADNSQQSAVESIRAQLQKHKLPSPTGHLTFVNNGQMNVGIFIAPGFTDTGMLESLILESLGEHPVKVASGNYIDNLRSLLHPENETCQYKFPTNIHKARMHAFLAGMEKYVPSAGMAALKGYFDLTSPIFNDVRGFLRQM
ncbi:DUF3226 domain-containing protein [Enterobacter mori]|uniref:DUF3226 domain-containing protein n=1 Tax=Enterobacter mori TaxID=539813 RepID=UPI0028AB2342|nr:DUF3226 domain-containing protein [Enterobacter mori]HED2467880.1 hypothetical protein [Enterobacter mori]